MVVGVDHRGRSRVAVWRNAAPEPLTALRHQPDHGWRSCSTRPTAQRRGRCVQAQRAPPTIQCCPARRTRVRSRRWGQCRVATLGSSLLERPRRSASRNNTAHTALRGNQGRLRLPPKAARPKVRPRRGRARSATDGAGRAHGRALSGAGCTLWAWAPGHRDLLRRHRLRRAGGPSDALEEGLTTGPVGCGNPFMQLVDTGGGARRAGRIALLRWLGGGLGVQQGPIKVTVCAKCPSTPARRCGGARRLSLSPILVGWDSSLSST